MVIEIESAYGDKRLTGKTLSLNMLKSIVDEILKETDELGFAAEFCSRLGYKELPYSEGYAAYVIDLDTHGVITPSYTFPNELDGAKVLYYTERATFEPVYFPGGEIAHNVSYLAICKYDNDDEYYIFHCDESLDVVADDCFHDVEICKKAIETLGAVLHKKIE